MSGERLAPPASIVARLRGLLPRPSSNGHNGSDPTAVATVSQGTKALPVPDTGVTFVGRLAQYRYYNMDQVVGAALAAAKRLIG